MDRLSFLIPSRNERFLQQTIDDISAHCAEDYEIIVTLDGYWPDPPLKDNPKLTIIHFGESKGMRAAINAAASAARGSWLCKIDAHCLIAPGFDRVVKEACEDNTIVVPRRYPLDAENWCIQDNGKPAVDYHYLSFPYAKPDEPGLHGERWNERAKARLDIPIDKEMSFQGSCWVMRSRHWRRLGGMSEVGYRRFVQESQEIGLKTQLGGGQVLTVKSTHYAHLHKGTKYGRMYYISKSEMRAGTAYSADFWMNNRWEKRTRDIDSLIEEFWPVPTWPENWRDEVPKWELGPDGLLRRKAQ